MTHEQSREIEPGLYIIRWDSGGESLAAVGMLLNGDSWYAPCNWSSEKSTGIASTSWGRVASVTAVETRRLVH